MMQMTESEICFRFRRNGCKRKHIQILAELNAVNPYDIEKILVDNGLMLESHNERGQSPR